MRPLARLVSAGDGRRPRGRAAPPRQRKRRRGLCLSQPGRVAVGRRPAGPSSPSLALGPRRPKVAVGRLIRAGWPSSCRINGFQFILYYLKLEMV